MNLITILYWSIGFAFVLGNVISSSNKNALPNNATELELRREVLRNMSREAWQAYMKHVSKENVPKQVWSEENARLILSAMTTLWVMELKEEFVQGRELIRNNFGNLSNVDDQIRVGRYMNEFVGSLLSCYALTNDTIFRDKAFEIAKILQPAYDNQTGIENLYFEPKTQERMHFDNYNLADIGSTVLEVRYLHSLAPDQFVDLTSQWRSLVKGQREPNRVLFSVFDMNTRTGDRVYYSLTSVQTQLFYANLVKAYAQSNGTDVEALELFVEALEAAEQTQLIVKANQTQLTYIRDYWTISKQFLKYMNYKGCNYGSLLQLSADALDNLLKNNKTISTKSNDQLNQTISKHRDMASKITETCHFAANKTAIKLPLPRFYMNQQEDGNYVQARPILISYSFDSGLEESYLVLWRATKEAKYRDYAWQLTQAYKNNFVPMKNYLNPVLLSSAFKFLYLSFSDDSVIPLDKWAFTPLGHPLPICGKNEALPKCA